MARLLRRELANWLAWLAILNEREKTEGREGRRGEEKRSGAAWKGAYLYSPKCIKIVSSD